MIYGETIKELRKLTAINEHTIRYMPTTKGAGAKEMFFYVGCNGSHDKSPRYKTAGDKDLFKTNRCHEIDYHNQKIHHKDKSSAKDAKLTNLGEKNSDLFGERYYIPLDINAKYPNNLNTEELVNLLRNDLAQFQNKGKSISGRVRCEYNPDAAAGSRYSLVEMDPNESYDDYISPEYGYVDK